ncbi:MAG: hypothetical protein HXX08_11075 [Chloroflexi bacterium]|uniref:Uncharacterized protein n=1 Tax=Candidatus Chlorohelix allophototropha TaxID=3003348 RepID=A0A8T7M2D2_9CHLR|nr:hypothetical protein [Chloroflexota bacterium]WJW65779.1 hypothetical protein OZ401_001558 [Chloroflexota bacterium L227-S17]
MKITTTFFEEVEKQGINLRAIPNGYSYNYLLVLKSGIRAIPRSKRLHKWMSSVVGKPIDEIIKYEYEAGDDPEKWGTHLWSILESKGITLTQATGRYSLSYLSMLRSGKRTLPVADEGVKFRKWASELLNMPEADIFFRLPFTDKNVINPIVNTLENRLVQS